MDHWSTVGKQTIQLIRSCLQEDFVLEEPLEIQRAHLHAFAKLHSVENMVYYGLEKNNVPLVGSEKLWEKSHKQAIYKEAMQDAELHSLMEMLENHQVKHMVLKGPILKWYYPTADMRSMADLDILVETSKLPKIKNWMKSLGYTPEHLGGNHDVYHKLPVMNVELHRGMMDESYVMSIYYQDIWNKVLPVEGTSVRYELKEEDFYIFMVAHAAKHYAQGGTGIRSVVDVWMYLNRQKAKLNWDYIAFEMDLLGVKEFEQSIKALGEVWFEYRAMEDVYQEMEEFIFQSGTYGTTIHAGVTRGFMQEGALDSLQQSKRKYVWNRFFPPYSMMKRRNPILQKLPFLLPVFWVLRLVGGVLKGRVKMARAELEAIQGLSQEEIERIKRIQFSTFGKEIRRKD